MADMEERDLIHFEYFFQLDKTFEAMNQILLLLQQLASSLEVGFSLLANGHLSPQNYKLFQIINMPRATDNGTHGVLFGNLPDYFAVSADLETFLEFSKDDVQDYSKIGCPLCKFHTGIIKRTARKSCAIAVFLNNSPRINTQCRKKVAELRGPEVVYMESIDGFIQPRSPMKLFSRDDLVANSHHAEQQHYHQ
ncbi:hypothetical protein OUZ56_024304 [Daphnia magna]|uniref:Uncharacterized protein n=1 Tax=Daphnia magna TaxID=35525 RepID=A0ABR0B0J8_9CRUS|nr:hypothetical protein OUZ56_024304 [Daphnia magna]